MKFGDRIKGIVFGPFGRIYGRIKRSSPPPTIESLLAKANGTRRVRTLDISDIAEIVGRCQDADDRRWAMAAGLVSESSRRRDWTTLAVAARIDGRTHLGIRKISADDYGSPVAGWREWAYFDGASPEVQIRKLRAWRDRHLNKSVIDVTPG